MGFCFCLTNEKKNKSGAIHLNFHWNKKTTSKNHCNMSRNIVEALLKQMPSDKQKEIMDKFKGQLETGETKMDGQKMTWVGKDGSKCIMDVGSKTPFTIENPFDWNVGELTDAMRYVDCIKTIFEACKKTIANQHV